MPTIDYLPVATAIGNNADSQVNFAGSGYQTLGFQTGIALPQQANKIWRQTSMMCAALAHFISNVLGINVLDDGNLTTLTTNLTNAITAGAGTPPTFQTNGVNNALQNLLNLVAGTNITLANAGGAVTISAAAFTPPAFQTNGSPNAVQTLLNLIAGTNMTLVAGGSGQVTINGPTLPKVVNSGSNKNLASNVGVSAYTQTQVDTITITFPGSGGPWRVIGDYSYFMNGGVGWQSGIFDGTNWFAQSQTQAQNNNSCLRGAGNSIGTYANGAVVTFHVYVFGDGAGTVVTTPAGEGSPSRVTSMGVSHMNLVVLSSN
jgi:hypothetical protein